MMDKVYVLTQKSHVLGSYSTYRRAFDALKQSAIDMAIGTELFSITPVQINRQPRVPE